MSEVFRVEKTGNYTVMSNYHLRDERLTLKAKGLLCYILSLPDDWDYTMDGLQAKHPDGITAIRSCIKNLEKAGYLRRRQTIDSNGRFSKSEYFVYEKPISEPPLLDFPTTVNPTSDNPSTEKPTSENQTQQNTYIQNTNQQNTYSTNYQPIKKEWWMENYDECLAHLYERIDLEYFPESIRDVVTDIIGYMADAFCSNLPTQRINGEEISRNRLITKLLRVSEETIDTVIDDFENLNRKIRNHRNYIISALYNATSSENVDSHSEFSRTYKKQEVRK